MVKVSLFTATISLVLNFSLTAFGDIDSLPSETEILSLYPHCEIDLFEPSRLTFQTVDLNAPLATFDMALKIISMTTVGKELADFFEKKIAEGELAVRPMPEIMLKNAPRGVQGAYVHALRTYYFLPNSRAIDWISNFVHELTHAKDGWEDPDAYVNEAMAVELEFRAYRNQDLFYQEFQLLIPCVKTLLSGFPRNYSREDIARLYGFPLPKSEENASEL